MFFLSPFAFSFIHCNQKSPEKPKSKACFVPSQSHTSWVEQNPQPNNSINKNKQTRVCFLVLGQALCVWDTAGLNSTVSSLCIWLRRLRSVTYSFISLSFFMSLCSVLLSTQGLTTCSLMLHLPIMTKHTETHRTDMSSELRLSIDFPLPRHTSLSLSHFPFTEIYDNPLHSIQGVKVSLLSVVHLNLSGRYHNHTICLQISFLHWQPCKSSQVFW